MIILFFLNEVSTLTGCHFLQDFFFGKFFDYGLEKLLNRQNIFVFFILDDLVLIRKVFVFNFFSTAKVKFNFIEIDKC